MSNSVFFLTIFVGALGTILLSRIIHRIMPSHYFTLIDLAWGFHQAPRISSIVLRLTVPLSGGVILGWIVPTNEAVLVAGLATGLAAFLLVFPVFLYPDEMIDPVLQPRRYAIYGIYVLFVFSFSLLGIVGALLVSAIKEAPSVVVVISRYIPNIIISFVVALFANLVSEKMKHRVSVLTLDSIDDESEDEEFSQ